MPVMTGDELVEVLQDDPELRAIPIIMATAAASPLRVKRMLALGCAAVLAKPMEEESFLAAVRRRARGADADRSVLGGGLGGAALDLLDHAGVGEGGGVAERRGPRRRRAGGGA